VVIGLWLHGSWEEMKTVVEPFVDEVIMEEQLG
jgi:hypothetical protein